MDLIFIQQKKIFDARESYPFSINIDKCTSNNHQKVFCYCDEKLGLSVVHHKSVSMVEVNTLTLFKKFVNNFKQSKFHLKILFPTSVIAQTICVVKKGGLEK